MSDKPISKTLTLSEKSTALKILAETDALVSANSNILDGVKSGKVETSPETPEQRQSRFFTNVNDCFARYQNQFGNRGLYSIGNKFFRENCFVEAAENTVRGDSPESSYIMDVLEETAFAAPSVGATVGPSLQKQVQFINKK